MAPTKQKMSMADEVATEPSAPGKVVVVSSQDAFAGGLWVTAEDKADAAEARKDSAFSMARAVVQAASRRAEYEALKVLAWRFPHGTHITAMSCAEESKAEHHAVYVSSEEVIHKIPPSGTVVADSWFSFLLKFPRWRIIAWPSDARHGDEIVKRARGRVGAQEGYSDLLGSNSECFVQECYTGQSSSTVSNVLPSAATASATGASAAAGAAAAAPYAVSTVTVYAAGFIPWGTATVVSGGVIAAGAAAGAVVGATVLAPSYWYYRRSCREASLDRLPFCIINQSGQALRVSTYKLNDTYRWVPVIGLAGQSAGDLSPQSLIELDPPENADEFQIEVTMNEAPKTTVSWVTSRVTSMVPRIFTSEDLRAVVRRGSVYRLAEIPAAAKAKDVDVTNRTDATASATADTSETPVMKLEIARVPRSVLPAYAPS